MKIATLGCSHSSDYAGDSWPIFLSRELNAELLQAYSSGAGNEMNIEKLRYLLDFKPDLIIVQLTDPVRLVLGLDSNLVRPYVSTPGGWRGEFCHTQHFKGSYYYTFNAHENDENLSRMLKRTVSVDNFMLKGPITSEYNLYHKVLHTISTMAFIAQKKNIPIVFFSWSVDIHKIIKEQNYSDLFNDLDIIPSFIEEFVLENSLAPISVGQKGAGHHAPANQEVIAKKYILPFLKLTHGQLCTSR
jgi:hypothetical protein